jgi:hypothetical protein
MISSSEDEKRTAETQTTQRFLKGKRESFLLPGIKKPQARGPGNFAAIKKPAGKQPVGRSHRITMAKACKGGIFTSPPGPLSTRGERETYKSRGKIR